MNQQVITKPSDAQLEHLWKVQYSHRDEDVVVNGNFLYEVLNELRELRAKVPQVAIRCQHRRRVTTSAGDFCEGCGAELE